jgi:L-serine dehydratase
MESISVFEIIKVGIGPSSSHTMGPWNAASAFIRIIKRERSIEEVKKFSLNFSVHWQKRGSVTEPILPECWV